MPAKTNHSTLRINDILMNYTGIQWQMNADEDENT